MPTDVHDELKKAKAALVLMYRAWDQLMPNLKNGVVQDYELVLTTAPLAAREVAGDEIDAAMRGEKKP